MKPYEQMTYEERIEHLEEEIHGLSQVLMDEFGGPDRSESACEMAVRVLREQKEQLQYDSYVNR